MADSNDSDRQAQLEEFKQLYLRKQLSEAAFRGAIKGLGFDPDDVFNQILLQVGHQTILPAMSKGMHFPADFPALLLPAMVT